MRNRNEQQWYDRDRRPKRSRLYRYMGRLREVFLPYPSRRRRWRRRIVWQRFFPVAICLALFLFGAVKLTLYLSGSHRAKQTEAELQAMYEPETRAPTFTPEHPTEIPVPSATPTAAPTPAPQIQPFYQQVGATIAPAMEELYEKNDDLIGWIKIPKVVSAPVVYRDNTYYLTHDFHRRKSSSGAIFLDEGHPLTAKTQNLLLYGHNMDDGTIFGHFGHYRKLSYWKEHCIAQFSSLSTQENYVIFAVMVVSTDPTSPDYVNFAGHPVFMSVKEFDAYMKDVRTHCLHPWRVDVNASDALMTMTTCLDEERVVLVARKLRTDETTDDLRCIINGRK